MGFVLSCKFVFSDHIGNFWQIYMSIGAMVYVVLGGNWLLCPKRLMQFLNYVLFWMLKLEMEWRFMISLLVQFVPDLKFERKGRWRLDVWGVYGLITELLLTQTTGRPSNGVVRRLWTGFLILILLHRLKFSSLVCSKFQI